ncbi:MAG: hypothetical protein RLZZ618_4293 [Pseudomonadota bacterium]|jgi:hypothetical protein
MTVSDARQPGALLGRYRRSRMVLFGVGIPALVIAAIGLFVFWLITRIGRDGLSFSGDVSILYATGSGLVALGLVLLLVAVLQYRAMPSFELHEHAVRVQGGGHNQFDFYEDIEYLYVYLVGGMGYRGEGKLRWVWTHGARLARYSEFIGRLSELHARYRGEKLYRALKVGQTVTLPCVPDAVARFKGLSALRSLNYKTFDITLTNKLLTIEGKSLPIERVADLNVNNWIDRSQIVDTEGKVFHAMHARALITGGVLFELIGRLQQDQSRFKA